MGTLLTMNKRNAQALIFVLVAALMAGRFCLNLRQRAARAYPDKFTGVSYREYFALAWEVMRWSGPHLAPEGTYHVTRYLSVPTPSGPVGLLPGQEVQVVREAGARVIVTAPTVTGTRELDVPRSALTDDLDLARNLAIRDRGAHDEFRTRLEAEEVAREQARLGLYREAAANLAAAERNRANDPNAGVGGRRSALDAGPVIHRSTAGAPAINSNVPIYYPSGTSGYAPTNPAGSTSYAPTTNPR